MKKKYEEQIKGKKRNEELLNISNNEKQTFNNRIRELETSINLKNNELNNLKLRINNNNPASNINLDAQIIAVNFITQSRDINRPMACRKTDIISTLEQKLYNEYPQYRDKKTFLTANGKPVQRFKSVDENKIKDGNSILVNIYENE